jgi:hypothetical protein
LHGRFKVCGQTADSPFFLTGEISPESRIKKEIDEVTSKGFNRQQ